MTWRRNGAVAKQGTDHIRTGDHARSYSIAEMSADDLCLT